MSIVPCPPSQSVTLGIVVFDPTAFRTAFPSFATLTNDQLQFAFDTATTMLSNTCKSRVVDAVKRERLLNMLTAHISAIVWGVNGQPPAGIVGRIDKATEGSVSVSAVMDTANVYGKDWYVQTPWGGIYWSQTASYRTAIYIPAPPVCADFNGGIGFPGSFWPNGGGGGGCGC